MGTELAVNVGALEDDPPIKLRGAPPLTSGSLAPEVI
jgi:hypothetical protein